MPNQAVRRDIAAHLHVLGATEAPGTPFPREISPNATEGTSYG